MKDGACLLEKAEKTLTLFFKRGRGGNGAGV